MVDRPRYHVALGDATCAPAEGLRLVSLTFPDATIAAVRYVQIPQWKELGIRAARVTLSIGYGDLLATLGDVELAAAAYVWFQGHAQAIARELGHLCGPEASIDFSPCSRFNGWEWEARFNQCVTAALRQE